MFAPCSDLVLVLPSYLHKNKEMEWLQGEEMRVPPASRVSEFPELSASASLCFQRD